MDIVLALISRNGATLAEIIEATGWQKHTVRGFISILGKAGTKVGSSKSEAGAHLQSGVNHQPTMGSWFSTRAGPRKGIGFCSFGVQQVPDWSGE
jgi:hypothetical protein